MIEPDVKVLCHNGIDAVLAGFNTKTDALGTCTAEKCNFGEYKMVMNLLGIVKISCDNGIKIL